MITWHIHIKGQVQGVGFRPFIYLLAQKYQLYGNVNNTLDGVHIYVNTIKKVLQEFIIDIKNNRPVLAVITNLVYEIVPGQYFNTFEIVHSRSLGSPNLVLTPDAAICDTCRTELLSSSNRRHLYPFITCINCGPRYSIVEHLPYDREHTTMSEFHMCPECGLEYEDPKDRRYYSQTNSCPNCRIELSLLNSKLELLSQDVSSIADSVRNQWKKGSIVAIKGIGGYLLTCDATDSQAIQKLRQYKDRPSKPFAIMMLQRHLESFVDLNDSEKEALQSSQAPIVLLKIKDTGLCPTDIAPGLSKIGVMLPYAPLYEILLEGYPHPVIATSCNYSNSPIIYEEKKVKEILPALAHFLLSHNRDIVVPSDDSVIAFSPFKKKRIVLRRARGIAPSYINRALRLSKNNIVAMGAMLKSTFGLVHDHNIYISQYIGSLESYDTLQSYKHTLNHLMGLFDMNPNVVLCDLHPMYPSTLAAQELSIELAVPLSYVQHHVAHFAAILGEHNLIDDDKAIMGVIWDGLGMGDDGQLWGGEFFTFFGSSINRIHAFDYRKVIANDKTAKESRVAALSYAHDIAEAQDQLQSKFDITEWKIYNTLLKSSAGRLTSSVGRLFDAVASLLGIIDIQSYEGEAAMLLEAKALQYFKDHGLDGATPYYIEHKGAFSIETQYLISQIVRDINRGVKIERIAAKFHLSLVFIIRNIAREHQINKICFSGGVFQNGLLIDLIIHYLNEDFELYFHKELSPNDENISFGQIVYHSITQKEKSNIEKNKNLLNSHKSNTYVFGNTG